MQVPGGGFDDQVEVVGGVGDGEDVQAGCSRQGVAVGAVVRLAVRGVPGAGEGGQGLTSGSRRHS